MMIQKQLPLGIKDIRGNEILAFIHAQKDKTFVECRPFCLAMGLVWAGQLEKIKSNPKFSCIDIYTTGRDGKTYSMVCLPVEQLTDWVMSINANKVAAEKKAVLLELQKVLQHGLNELVHERYVTSGEVRQIVEAAVGQLAQEVAKLAEENRLLRERILLITEENQALRTTNQSLWKARNFEGSSASYGLHAAKERKKAATTLQ